MVDSLKELLKLHGKDREIDALLQKSKNLPENIRELESEIQSVEELVANARGKEEDLGKELKQVENSITEHKESLEKSRKKLKSITTNKEYDAVHLEIDAHENAISQGAKNIREAGENQEKAAEDLKEKEALYEEIKSKYMPELDKLKEEMSGFDSELDRLKNERSDITSKIDNKFVEIYERIRKKRKKGSPIGYFNEQERRCGSCYSKLLPKQFVSAKRNDGLIFCENCGAILVFLEEKKDEEAPASEAEEAKKEKTE